MSDITKGYTFNDNEQVTADKLNNLVDNATINTGAVGSDDLAVDAVTASKIANDAVTTDKVQDGAITRDKLAEDAMGIKSVQRFNGSVNGPAASFTEVIDLNVDGNPVDFSKTSVSGNFSNYTNRARFITLDVNESTQEITITFFGPDSTGYYVEVLEFY